MSQSQLASRLCELSGRDSVTREQVSRWETGKRTPGPYWLRRLATALQVYLYALEYDDGDRRTFITDLVATVVAPVLWPPCQCPQHREEQRAEEIRRRSA